jgi:ribosome biogenesis GTPase
MLSLYGWTDDRQHGFARHAAQGLLPARVIEQQRGLYRVIAERGEFCATLSGRFAFEAAPGDHPTAGDWVALALRAEEGAAAIQALLTRTSAFTRRAPDGGTQVVAANLDIAFLVSSLNGDLNLRRLERYLAVARAGGALPVIVLTKADICADAEARAEEVRAIAGDASVHVVSAATGVGLDALAAHLSIGKTAALLGSSGVGKSTLVNALIGAPIMATQAISGDGKRGRHTTTHRQLVLLPSGGLLLDSPGMRELGVWTADAGVAATFADVETLIAACRFRNCSHGNEPDCAVRAALADGALDESRWRSYRKLLRELAFEARKDDPVEAAAHRNLWKQRTKNYRASKKRRDRSDDG